MNPKLKNSSFGFSIFTEFMKNLFLLFILFFFLFSCKEDKLKLPWVELESPTSMTLNSVYFTSDSVGYVVGGDLWFDDIYLRTINGGESWTFDSLGGKELYAINFDKNNNGFTGGINGQFYFKEAQQDNWEPFYPVSYTHLTLPTICSV